MTTLNLTEALNIFEPHLSDIADSLATNVTAKIEALPPIIESDDENVQWVRKNVRELEVEKITNTPLKVIGRIQSKHYFDNLPPEEKTDRITPQDIQRAKEVPIEDHFTGELTRKGRRLWGISPFRVAENTGSFCIHPDNRWSDFGDTDSHGDVIDYIMKRDGVDFVPAVKILNNM